jgi:hypothetical protein
VGSSLNQRAAEFSLCNTLVLLLDLAFKQYAWNFTEQVCRRKLKSTSGLLVNWELPWMYV